MADATFDSAHVRLMKVDPAQSRAQVEINAGIGERASRTKTWVKRGDDLSR